MRHIESTLTFDRFKIWRQFTVNYFIFPCGWGWTKKEIFQFKYIGVFHHSRLPIFARKYSNDAKLCKNDSWNSKRVDSDNSIRFDNKSSIIEERTEQNSSVNCDDGITSRYAAIRWQPDTLQYDGSLIRCDTMAARYAATRWKPDTLWRWWLPDTLRRQWQPDTLRRWWQRDTLRRRWQPDTLRRRW